MNVIVIGAGINGLSTAVRLQKLEPRAKVTLVSDKFSPDTTSDIAAGYWMPFIEPTGDQVDLIDRWGDETYQHILDLYKTDAVRYGAGLESGYILHDCELPEELPYWSKTVHNYNRASQRQLASMGWTNHRSGEFLTSTYLESSKYLPELQKEFEASCGKVVRKKLNNLNELYELNPSLVINCTGMGAYHLFGDTSCYPVRGQIIKVYAPHLKHFTTEHRGDEYHYVLINHEAVTLGGTKQVDRWDTKPDPVDRKRILENCLRFVPELKGATILKDVVGLRPGRDNVRLECEVTAIAGKAIPVVHNYGHHGSGITLHWGCAGDAARLASDAMHKPLSKL